MVRTKPRINKNFFIRVFQITLCVSLRSLRLCGDWSVAGYKTTETLRTHRRREFFKVSPVRVFPLQPPKHQSHNPCPLASRVRHTELQTLVRTLEAPASMLHEGLELC